MSAPQERAPAEALGPNWLWLVVWSLQGVAVVAVSALGLESEAQEFMLMGALAGVPLVGLRVVLARRAKVQG